MSADAVEPAPARVTPDPVLLGKGLAAIRIFFGLILFANGLAKLLDFRNIEIGPYRSFLIDRAEARSILDFETNRRGGDGSDVPGLKALVNDVILPSWDVLQWMITLLELGTGLALIVGLATRGAALLAFGQQLFLQLVYLSSARWMFEQPHEWVPLLVFVLVPAGRVWGLDGRFAHRGIAQLRGFPF